jgi:hypothetical protein
MSASAHRQLIAGFYQALDRRDAATMVACYAPDATFTDPVFGTLDRAAVGAMWRMLCGRATDLNVTAINIDADERHGSAHWTARYSYGPTRRRVINEIDAALSSATGDRRARRPLQPKWKKQALR